MKFTFAPLVLSLLLPLSVAKADQTEFKSFCQSDGEASGLSGTELSAYVSDCVSQYSEAYEGEVYSDDAYQEEAYQEESYPADSYQDENVIEYDYEPGHETATSDEYQSTEGTW